MPVRVDFKVHQSRLDWLMEFLSASLHTTCTPHLNHTDLIYHLVSLHHYILLAFACGVKSISP